MPGIHKQVIPGYPTAIIVNNSKHDFFRTFYSACTERIFVVRRQVTLILRDYVIALCNTFLPTGSACIYLRIQIYICQYRFSRPLIELSVSTCILFLRQIGNSFAQFFHNKVINLRTRSLSRQFLRHGSNQRNITEIIHQNPVIISAKSS